MELETIEEVNPNALVGVEWVSKYFKQDAVADHDAYGKIRWAWEFTHDGMPVEVHMLRTLNGQYALAVADFGMNGAVARDWSKQNKNLLKDAKSRLCKAMNSDFFGDLV
jgi:hypothetical protein